MRAQDAYDELLRRARAETLLASCAELLAWDEETYLPRAGVALRAEQLALLSGMLHERGTDPTVAELLAAVESSPLVADSDGDVTVNVREWRRIFDRSVRVPRSLVEEISRVSSFAQQAWAEARQHADFRWFEPWLERIVTLERRRAECLGYEADPYDALLEDYEPGARSADLTQLFQALRDELVPLVNALTHARRRPDAALLRGDFPLAQQRRFCTQVAADLGFDFAAGRLDSTTHPFFAVIGPGDCRIATRYDPRCFNDGFFATLHEVGHALYEQGLDPAHHGTPLGESSSLGVHESQARLWENAVGRSLPFWKHFFPRACEHFPALAGVGVEDFHFAVNNVEPTLIRVTADEVTYNLHILIRFELERALVRGELAVAELPDAWNAAYRHHLGLTPANDAEGCLQDGHWGAAMIGYFPTYTLGNLFAAQLFARAREDLGDLDAALARGEFRVLLDWLRVHVHRAGGRYSAQRLIARATGAPPDHRPLVRALREKYSELYGL
jgi:carboxypeptidase Taq